MTALDAPGLKVPHMGWEPVRWERESRFAPRRRGDQTPFYFVHSFAARPADPDVVVGTAEWGERFAAVVERDSVLRRTVSPREVELGRAEDPGGVRRRLRARRRLT